MVDRDSLVFFLVLMFVVCFVFPLTINYIAQGYDVPSEVRFFTVVILAFLVVCFTVFVWGRVRG